MVIRSISPDPKFWSKICIVRINSLAEQNCRDLNEMMDTYENQTEILQVSPDRAVEVIHLQTGPVVRHRRGDQASSEMNATAVDHAEQSETENKGAMVVREQDGGEDRVGSLVLLLARHPVVTVVDVEQLGMATTFL